MILSPEILNTRPISKKLQLLKPDFKFKSITSNKRGNILVRNALISLFNGFFKLIEKKDVFSFKLNKEFVNTSLNP